MNKILLLLILSCYFTLNAQVTFIIDSLPDYTPPEDHIFLAGDINGWNPGDFNHIFIKNENNKWQHKIDSMPEGITIEFKFTRGDWGKVEKGPEGEEINNRSFTFGNSDTVHVVIYNWADFGGGGNSTAAENVIIMDEEFYMPQLDRTRRIWIYFPPDYEENDRSYPILYMHDGQNLFDQITSFAGEWEVDETLNELASEGYQVPIVVGIDNGGAYRIDELTPWFNAEYGGGQGDEYMAFIVETLKPHIDATYRTLPGRENTGIMGSSLGGLISTYGTVKYQDVFSKSGPFSPAYWINNDSIWDFISLNGMQEEIRFYQNIGELEPATSVEMMHQMEDSLRAVGFSNVISKVISGGEHNEQTWRDDFRNAYLWLFDSYANNVTEHNYITLHFSPNPVIDYLQIQQKELKNQQNIQYQIVDSMGKKVMSSVLLKSEIDVNLLQPGVYIITVDAGKTNYTAKFIKQ